jgi:hypothetical protein
VLTLDTYSYLLYLIYLITCFLYEGGRKEGIRKEERKEKMKGRNIGIG